MQLWAKVLCLTGIVLWLSAGALAGTIHVPADYSTIQAGINAAVSGADTVIVAPGTYTGTGNRDLDFNGKAITIRSINPNDSLIVEATVIDCQGTGRGFYFHNGEGLDSVLAGITITNGSGPSGGGLYIDGSSPAINRCLITGNSIPTSPRGANKGGGVMCRNNSNPVISKCKIANNSSQASGGGIYCEASNPTIVNCIISDNYARMGGGGIYCQSGNATIKQCVIINNVSQHEYGGGIYDSLSDIIVSNSIIRNNLTQGAYTRQLEGFSSGEVTYCNVQGGFSGTGNIGSDPLFFDVLNGDYHLTNLSPCINTGDPDSLISPGETDIDGDPRILFGRIDIGVDEFAENYEPIIEVSASNFAFVTNEAGDNPSDQILNVRNIGGGTLNWSIDTVDKPDWVEIIPFNGSLVSGESENVVLSIDNFDLSWGQYSYGFEVIDATALNSPQAITINLEVVGPKLSVSQNVFIFKSPVGGNNPANQNLIVQNAGSGTVNWLIDITEKPDWLTITPTSGSLSDGENEPVALSVDVTGLSEGLYSYAFDIFDPDAENSPQTIDVNFRVGYIRVPDAYSTIQDAIDAAVNGDTIMIEPGIYTGGRNRNLDFGGKAIIVRSIDPSDPDIVDITVIDCQRGGRGFYFHNSEGPDSVLAGLTIANGRAPLEDQGGILRGYGGGIYCYYSSPTINNCTFMENVAYYTNDKGGGMYNNHSHPVLNECNFINNSAGYGGGMFNYDSDPTLTNCLFTGNSALFAGGDGGGGLRNKGGYPSLTGCIFKENSAPYGGGLSHEAGELTLTNCIFIRNSSSNIGGGIALNLQSYVMLDNCTFFGNMAIDGRAIAADRNFSPTGSSSIDIVNCILWDGGEEILTDEYAFVNVSYSNIKDGYAGAGNINADPLFVQGPKGDYYLSQSVAGQGVTSPSVDAGSDTAANLGFETTTTRTDQVGDAGIVDMGYHYPAIPIVGDISGDFKVDIVDFRILASQWLGAPGTPSADIAPQPGGNNTVDLDDLSALMENWLEGTGY